MNSEEAKRLKKSWSRRSWRVALRAVHFWKKDGLGAKHVNGSSRNEDQLATDPLHSVPQSKEDSGEKSGSVSESTSTSPNKESPGRQLASQSPVEKKLLTRTITQPPGTTKYVVKASDTLTGIAARFDTLPGELAILNRLASRQVFVGQILFVPVENTGNESSGKTRSPVRVAENLENEENEVSDEVEVKETDSSKPDEYHQHGKDFGMKPRIEISLPAKFENMFGPECQETVLKISSKYITHDKGIASGTLLVTPDKLKFIPNVFDVLVIDHGVGCYEITAPFERVATVGLYCDMAQLDLSLKDHAPKVEVCHLKNEQKDNKGEGKDETFIKDNHDVNEDNKYQFKAVGDETELYSSRVLKKEPYEHDKVEVSDAHFATSEQTPKTGMPEPVCSLSEAEECVNASIKSRLNIHAEILTQPKEVNQENGEFVKTEDASSEVQSDHELKQSPAAVEEVKKVSEAFSQSLTSPVRKYGSKGDIGDGNSSEDPAKTVRSKEKLAHSDGETEHITNRLKYLTPYKRRVSKALSSSPKLCQSFPSNLRKSESDIGSFTNNNSAPTLKQEISGAELPENPPNSPVAPENHPSSDARIWLKNMVEENPELFAALDELLSRRAQPKKISSSFYLCLTMRQTVDQNTTSVSKASIKDEYWFDIPEDKVDELYDFFQRWAPDIYSDVDNVKIYERSFLPIGHHDEENRAISPELDLHHSGSQKSRGLGPLHFFKIFDGTSAPGNLSLSDWEVVSLSEACRHSPLDMSDVLPEMLQPSEILTEEQRREICKRLPGRAQGYAWDLIYSTSKHGFSIQRMYREMVQYDTPVLIVILDTDGAVFGAMVSCTIKRSEHFCGTGESFLFTFNPEFRFYPWTGMNTYVVKGNANSLAFGSGDGQFGLWLDGDLYHGSSRKCKTFGNEILSKNEDFVVKTVEAWGFV